MRFGEEATSLLLADDTHVIPHYGEPVARGGGEKGAGKRWLRRAVWAASLGGAAWAVVSSAPASGRGDVAAYSAKSARPALAWAVTNKYVDALGPIGSSYAWTSRSVQVVDPHAPFKLVLTTPVAPEETVAWILSNPDGSVGERLWGVSAAASAVAAVGDYGLRVSTLSPEGYVSRVGDGTVAVRYVRREVRDLSDSDRNRWLDALANMWRVDGAAGRARYGAAFISADELLALHATNSALRDNDHFHNGAGFLAQHLRLDTMVLESLQVQDAAIASPYWDWTIETRAVEVGAIASPFDTDLWTADWFGSLNFVEEPVVIGEHYGLSTDEFFAKGFAHWAIRDGRWAFATVKRYDDPATAPYPVNSYGYLRSPWNNNPSPYVTRVNFQYNADNVASGASIAKTLPSCRDLYNFLTEDTNAVYFMTHLEDMTVHANVHQVLGGTIIDVVSAEKMAASFENIGSTAAMCYQTVSERHLWRLHMAEVRAGCDPDAADSSAALRACQLDCNALSFEAMAAIGAWVADAYQCPEGTALRAAAGDFVASDVPDADLAAVGEAMCGASFLKGEHLEASGTTDPSFFLVHPTLARYYQMRRLMPEESYNDNWASADNSRSACEPAIGACYADGDGQADVASGEDCCAGHFRYSTYFVDIARTPAPEGTLKNEEILARAHPANAGAENLVFHHLAFDHCEEDFAALLGDHTNSTSPPPPPAAAAAAAVERGRSAEPAV